MLYPEMNESRLLLDLGGIWSFQTSQHDSWTQEWTLGPLPNSINIAVPASYNDQKDDINLRNHYGWCVYQRTFTLPRFMTGSRIVIRFGSVTHSSQVFLNGQKLCEHKGGFLPFECEISQFLKSGENRLTVAVDNRVNYSTLPVGNEGSVSFFGSDNPGIPSIEKAKLRSKQQNRPNFDFFNYAGITRPVKIYTTPQDYIKDISIVTKLNKEDGEINYTIETVGEGEITITILNELNEEVAHSSGSSGHIVIRKATFWYPGSPYLYKARVTFSDDVYEQPFGIRSVKVEGDKFFINEKPFYFKGFGKHEDSFFRGRGTDECLNVKDTSLIRWFSANSFRTSHYPYAEEMYNLCDREGIVVIDEVPAVGINCGGKQNPYDVMHIKEHHEDVIREMILRDKNHPCVVMWSLANEPDTENFPESANDYFMPLYALAHKCDPQNRPVTLVCCQNNYQKDIITRKMDVCCINRYYCWYNLSGDLDAACDAWNIELDFWSEIGKPLIVTEYGANTYPGIHNTIGEMFSEEYQMNYYERINEILDKRSFLIGEHVWNFADFATIQGPMRVDGNKKGLLTRDRRPKLAAHYFRKRWANIPNFNYK